MTKRNPLFTRNLPELPGSRLVLAFSGWMDGGDVSTGTVRFLAGQTGARKVGRVQPDGFYIQAFPGSMEIAAMFRPHVRIVDGRIKNIDLPTNEFFVSPESNLFFFIGREPNLNWELFADSLFDFARKAGVTQFYFVGTFAGAQPHTRQPRLYVSATDREMIKLLEESGVRPSTYEGPASFSTYLMATAPRRKLSMTSLVAEIPGYVEGINPMSIEAVARRLAGILGMQVEFDNLRRASDEWEERISAAVAKNDDLAKEIRKLEEQYDNELIGRSE